MNDRAPKTLHAYPALAAATMGLISLCNQEALASEHKTPLGKDASEPPSTLNFQPSSHSHWAFQPVRLPPLPAVKDQAWLRSPVDAFVLAKLEGAGLRPAPAADRRTLIRRVYFDLIGLPPTFEEVEAFVQDPSPEAFNAVMDRLLSSPRYGERWGRHWLDVARYADTKDLVLLFGTDRIRPYAYTYRDYVIRALNEDLPYDQFLHDQLAADQIEPNVGAWRLAAMGFLTLGRLYDNNLHDIYDDQIDTVSRGLLGLTVACARCHDHKYDPIPTEDYYSLYGVFASSERPLDLPLIEKPRRSQDVADFETKWAAKRKELQDHVDAQFQELTEAARQRVGDYLLKIATEKPDPLENTVFFLSLSPDDLRPQFISRWRRYLERNARPTHPVFGPWHDLMTLRDDEYGTKMEAVLNRWKTNECGTAEGQLNPLVHEMLATARFAGRGDVARAYGALFNAVYQGPPGGARLRSSPDFPAGNDSRARQESRPTEQLVHGPDSRPKGSEVAQTGSIREDAARDQLLAILTGPESPTHFPKRNTSLYMSRVPKDKFGGLVKELDKLAVAATNAPARAMILSDSSELYDPHVFVRGNPGNPGQKVPRRFLRALEGDDRRPFAQGSGRLDLAKAITSLENPLTARVIVNRVWMHHLGEPLVSTPSDFGTRSAPPSYPELLDYLAWNFQRDGWSLKKLHRLILLSNTYQQSSRDRAECRRVDPDNKLLWRFQRRRLDLESMRDALLVVSSRLDCAMGGRPVDVAGDPGNRRRTIYGLVDRQDLPALFRCFDFASPDQSADRRPQTIVPQQALFAMNSPFALAQAKALADRVKAGKAGDECARIHALYRLVFSREPRPDEIQSALRFLETTASESSSAESDSWDAWQQFAQVLLMSNEFMFVD
ncbi:MAG: DUF1553 domain-containing protein [Verrucomicrobia bacterium]|nr:DUF1553 domain-containing protein [Verrucomicrobiota bacterium]